MDRRQMLALVVEGQAAVHAFDWHRVGLVLGRMATGLAAAVIVPEEKAPLVRVARGRPPKAKLKKKVKSTR